MSFLLLLYLLVLCVYLGECVSKRRTLLDIKCLDGQEPLVSSIQNYLYKQHHPYLNRDEIDCCYQPIQLINGSITTPVDCTKFETFVKLSTDYAKVECSFNGTLLYEDYFWKKFQYSRRRAPDRPHRPLNVILLILADLSKNNFHKLFPQTKNYLLNRLNFQAFEYLQGHSAEGRENLKKNLLNKYTWNSFKDNSFRIGYAEDCYANLLGNGGIPDFHYSWNDIYKHIEWNVGSKETDCSYCLGSQKSHIALLDYSKKLILTKTDSPTFAAFYLNALAPYNYKIQNLDSDFLNFFNNLHQPLTQDTVFFFLSDTNTRKIRHSKIHNSLPFLFISIPDGYRRRFPLVAKKFWDNRDKMITYKDIYLTLIDFVNPYKFDKYYYRGKRDGANKTEFSLFEGIPGERTCRSADIDETVCFEGFL